jgi:hypothetical protein
MLLVKYMFFKILILKFKISKAKKGTHQVGPNCNFPEIFRSLALKGETVGVAQISPYGGGGGT